MIDTAHIAKLARLELTKEEMKKMEKDLSCILEYFEMLNEIDVSKTDPGFHALDIKNIMREDKIEAGSLEQKGHVKVKQVL